ncbi:MAG: hypothetical protein OHK0013_03570 [Sandaracinaceae bacterium]
MGVSKHVVIDGQQRLTTIALFLIALRSLLPPDSKEARKLTRLLVNEDDEDLDHYKLLPTQQERDRDTFRALVDGGDAPANARMARAVAYFRERLAGTDSEGEPIDLERVIATLATRLTVVSIHLAETDDPYLIFESLNAKGTPLTQADLIRNYLLLRLRTQDQERLYRSLWMPMQNLLGTEHLTEFMRQYLMLGGDEVASSSIYAVLKKRLYDIDDAKMPDELARMQRASVLYARIVGVSSDGDAAIASRLARLRRWGVSVANPFLLRLLDAHASGTVTAQDVASCLDIIESFVVRRAICNVPTNQLKRIFLALTKTFTAEGTPAWLAKTLASGTAGRRWPKDDELDAAWQTYRAYAASIDRCKLMLETLENSYQHRERVDPSTATIEHVMPQTLTDEWRACLGPDATAVHERWLHCMGNLTLTAYNPELSNSPFTVKRERLRESHFELSRWIAQQETWTAAEIEARGKALAEKAKTIWARSGE